MFSRKLLTSLAAALAATALIMPHATSASAATIGLYELTAGSTASSDTEASTSMSNLTLASNLSGAEFTNNRLEIGGNDTNPTGSGQNLTLQLTNAINNNLYFTFTLTIPDTVVVNLTQLQFDYATLAGFRFGIGLFTDATGFASSTDALAGSTIYLGDNQNTNQVDKTVSLAGASFQGLTDTTLEFRFYVSDGSSVNTRAHYFDNIELFGDVSAVVPEPASLALFGLGGLMIASHRRRR